MIAPDTNTEICGVVGHPVSHSLSPAFWNPALQHDGRNAVFLAFDVEPRRFEAFLAGMDAAGVRGLNVTMPHKAAAFETTGHHSEEATLTHAVNAVTFGEDGPTGHNTDMAGLRRALADLGIDRGAKALVIGAGGAGRAAAWTVVGDGGEVLLANRTRARAESLRQAIGRTAVVVDTAGLSEAAAEVDVIVHTAAVGLDGETLAIEEPVLAAGAGGRCRAVLDVVYARGETPLVHAARAAGIEAKDGLDMLVYQAAEAYSLFWDADAPLQVMREAAYEAAERPLPD